MKKIFRIGVLLGALTFNFTSCKNNEPEVQPTVQETVIFKDDFKDNKNNWYQKDNDTAVVSIKNDSLFFTNKNKLPAFGFWNRVVIDETKNFSIKVSITKKSGDIDAGFGILWGVKDDKNYYAFEISQQRAFAVAKFENGTVSPMAAANINNAINYGSNILEIRKEGNDLVMKANGTLLYSIAYPSLYGNGLGFVAEKNSGIAIDYIQVSQW